MSLITFNGYAVSGTVFRLERPFQARQRLADTSRRAGTHSQGGLLAPKRISVRGFLKATDLTDQTEKWDSFLEKLPYAAAYPLTVEGETGREYLAEVESVEDTIDPQRFGLEYDIVFFVPDGTSRSVTPTTGSLATSGGTLTPQGNEYAYPAFHITVSSTGSGGSFTLRNETTGEAMAINPVQTGVYSIDSYEETIERGGTDRMRDWASGVFLRLRPGANILQISTTGGCALSSVTYSYRSRWR